MKQPNTYGREAAKHAKVLISQGWTNEQIKEVEVCASIPFETLRTWRNRMKRKSETQREAIETLTSERQNELAEIALADAENSVSSVSKTAKSVSIWSKTVSHFSLMHLVFYVTTLTACYAVWDTLPNVIGAALLTVYGLFSLDSLLKAQDGKRPELAEYGRNRVIVSELIAAVFHAVILNKYLWINRASLPFEIKLLPPKNGNFEIDFRGQILNGVWHNGEVIFYISVAISALLFVAAFAAVDAVLRANKADGNG